MTYPPVLSFGAGVNSGALAILLVNEGWRGHIVFSDTGTEWADTYCWMDYFEREWLRPRGLEITRLGAEWRSASRNCSMIELCERRHMIPVGRGGRWCTSDYKIRPFGKWARANGIDPETAMLGIAADESWRMMSANRPLVDRGVDRDGCVRIIQAEGLDVPRKSGCYICLAGETEVITPQGAKPIADLVGKATVLVPMKRSAWGEWKGADIHSFGVQRLIKITLRRYCAHKTIYATPEHRWVTKDQTDCWLPFKSTRDLRSGDVVPSCRAISTRASRHPVEPSPFGIAHGFAFGDGTLERNSHRPMSLVLYRHKDIAMLRYFAACTYRDHSLPTGKKAIYVYGLPRYWKRFPPLDECRGYLLGWLAGYFAADGHVSKAGQANIYSSLRENIAFVRDVCYLLGVQTSPIITKVHPGICGPATLHSTNIYTRDLPESVWLNAHHLERIQKRHSKEDRKRQDWIVESVEETNRLEEVYCAMVPDSEMFTLADGVVTGNCPFQRDSQWRELWQRYPELYARAEALEADRTRSGKGPGIICTIAMDRKTTLAMRRLRYEGQVVMFDESEMDKLMEYRPCVCHI